jgi:hypothetical protein
MLDGAPRSGKLQDDEPDNEDMMNKPGMLFFLFLLSVAAGCSSVSTVSRVEWSGEKVPLTPELLDLYKDIGREASFVHAVDGYADIRVKTPRKDEKLYCNVQVERARDARFIVSAGILGWPVADMLIRQDSLFVHDMINNLILEGKNNEDNIEKIIGVHSGFNLLSEALLGIMSVPESYKSIESVRIGSGKVSYTVRLRSGKKEMLVNPDIRVLEGLALIDGSGRRTVDIHFRNFEELTVNRRQVKVPREIDMMLHNRRYDGAGEHRLIVVYDERNINPPGFRIRFSRPSRARLVNLDDVGVLPWL